MGGILLKKIEIHICDPFLKKKKKKRVFDLGGSLFGLWVAIKSIYLSNQIKKSLNIFSPCKALAINVWLVGILHR